MVFFPFYQPLTLRLEVQEKETYHFSQSWDDFAEGGEWLVNVGAFLQAGAFSAGWIGSFWSGQIHKTDLTHLKLFIF